MSYDKIYHILLGSLLLFSSIITGCIYSRVSVPTVHHKELRQALEKLGYLYPQYWSSKQILIVFMDDNACAGNLQEIAWWPDWQKYADDHGMEFIIVTNESDSADLEYALKLENVQVPILFIPGRKEPVSDMWYHPSLILKILYDTKSMSYRTWLESILDSTSSRLFLEKVDKEVNRTDYH